MPVDPQVRVILDQGRTLPPLETLSVEAARKRCINAFCAKGLPEPVKIIRNISLNLVVDNAPCMVPVRMYIPDADSPTRQIMIWFYSFYLPGKFIRDDPYLFPLCAKNLENLPPCRMPG